MSKLEELIQQYCPDGVEWKMITELADTFIGLATSVTKYKMPEGILLLHNSDIKEGKIELKSVEYLNPDFVKKNKSKVLHTDDIITVHTGDVGTSAVITSEYDGTIGFTTISSRIKDKGLITPAFLCKVLNSGVCKNAIATKTISDRNNLNLSSFDELEIPVPPLPVQEEIVRILDTFTELQAELQAELQKRLQQYNYYRDDLLSFEGRTDVEWKKIKDVYKRLKGTPITAGKMREIECSAGEIRIFAGGKTVINANESDIPNANITRVPALLVQSRGVIDVVFYDKPFTFKNEMWAYTADNATSVKYLYYVMKSNIQTFRDAASGMGSLPQISLGVTEDYVIPVPSLAEQQRIVDILDRFDSLTNDLTAGLPAEIEKRKQQYEYYRDKLLTFKRKEA